MIQPGTAVWFAQHESQLAWRDWLSMMTAGRRERRRRVAIGIAIFLPTLGDAYSSSIARMQRSNLKLLYDCR